MKILRFLMLCTYETQGTQHMISMQKLKFSSLPRAELTTLKWCNPAAFICNCYCLFGGEGVGEEGSVVRGLSPPSQALVQTCAHI